jgi:hypothetical protein
MSQPAAPGNGTAALPPDAAAVLSSAYGDGFAAGLEARTQLEWQTKALTAPSHPPGQPFQVNGRWYVVRPEDNRTVPTKAPGSVEQAQPRQPKQDEQGKQPQGQGQPNAAPKQAAASGAPGQAPQAQAQNPADPKFEKEWAAEVEKHIDEIERNDVQEHPFDAQQTAAEQNWHAQYIEWRWGLKTGEGAGKQSFRPLNAQDIGIASRFVSGLIAPALGGASYVAGLLDKSFPQGKRKAPPELTDELAAFFDRMNPGEDNRPAAELAAEVLGPQAKPLVAQMAKHKGHTEINEPVEKPKVPAKPANAAEKQRAELKAKISELHDAQDASDEKTAKRLDKEVREMQKRAREAEAQPAEAGVMVPQGAAPAQGQKPKTQVKPAEQSIEDEDTTGLRAMGHGMANAVGENFRQQMYDSYQRGSGKMAGVPEVGLAVAKAVGPGLKKDDFVKLIEEVQAVRNSGVSGAKYQDAMNAIVQKWKGETTKAGLTPPSVPESNLAGGHLSKEPKEDFRRRREVAKKRAAAKEDNWHRLSRAEQQRRRAEQAAKNEVRQSKNDERSRKWWEQQQAMQRRPAPPRIGTKALSAYNTLSGGALVGAKLPRRGVKILRPMYKALEIATKDFDASKHPRGQPGNPGQFGPGGGSNEDAPEPAASAPAKKAKPKVPEKQRNEKAELAKKHYKATNKEVQRYAETYNEPRFAKVVGGVSHPDNEPMDVTAKSGDLCELKTMVDNSNSKITMDSYSQVRKIVKEQETGKTFHTIVSDDQAIYNAKGEGQHGNDKDRVYYYRRGVAGSARLEGLHRCKDEAELKKLMAMPEDKLPSGAQRTDGHLRVGKWKASVDAEGRKQFTNTKTGQVFKAKK